MAIKFGASHETSLFIGTEPIKRQSSGKSIPTGVSSSSIEDVVLNLGIVGKAVMYEAAISLAETAVTLLSLAQPRVPYETGQLRESGTALLLFGFGGKYGLIVGKARKPQVIRTEISGGSTTFPKYSYAVDPSIDVDLSRITISRVAGTGKFSKKITSIDAYVSYDRENEEEEDIALWTHEAISPFGSSSRPRARQPGTGPKYLEIAWLESKDRLIAHLNQVVTRCLDNLKKGIKYKKPKNPGKYTVNEVKLVESLIKRHGYYYPLK